MATSLSSHKNTILTYPSYSGKQSYLYEEGQSTFLTTSQGGMGCRTRTQEWGLDGPSYFQLQCAPVNEEVEDQV